MADVADEGIIEGIIEDVNDTSVVPQANASWLCGSAGPLWNHTLSWDTGDGNPDLTPCLRTAIWSFPPFILFYVLLPIHIRSLFRSQSRNVPMSSLSVAKVITIVILISVSVMDLCFWSIGGGEINLIDVTDPALRLLTFAPLLVLLFVERARGFRISHLQFLTFLLYLTTSLLPFYSRIKQLSNNSDRIGEESFPAVTFLVSFACIVVNFICHFFVEKNPTYTGPNAPEDTPNPCPEILASCPSGLFFSWFTGIAWTGMKRPLVAEDLWDLNPIIASRTVVPRFNRHWEKLSNSISFIKSSSRLNNASFSRNADNVEIKPSKKEKSKYSISIFPSLVKAFGFSFLFGSIFKLIHDLMVFAQPVLQKFIIQFANDSSKPLWQGIFFAVLLLCVTIGQTIILSQYFYRMYLVGIWVRAAVTSAIYRKALRVSQASKKEITTGEVVNLMSVDVQRLVDMMPYLNMVWSAPMQIVLALSFLWFELGPSVLAGLLVMILLIPVNGAIAAKSRQYQMQQMKQKDQRVKMMNEILQGMKILKLFAWEESFQKLVSDIRDKEISILTKNAYLQAGSGFIWAAAPFVVSLVTFATYVLIDENNVLDSEKAFVSLSLFNILRFPMSMLPMMIAGIVQASVSIKRINKFMNSEEVDANAIENQSGEGGGNVAIKMEDASFSWDREAETPTIKNVSLDVKKGQLVAVVGTVGCGKSSLISSFLGEMEKVDGRVTLNGSIAYVAQQAWIMNETLKNNILFNQPYDEAKYKKCLEGCALDPDLKMLPGGDETEIGEKGINLSGGQKQRVSLARACYSNADIYLLDDPLSAVDAHVGKHIFEQVIGGGLLRDKTRVLVTHGVSFLPKVDNIVVLKDGEISEVGTYQELMDSKGAFAEFLVQYLTTEEGDDVEDSDQISAIKNTLEQTMGKEELQRNISRLRSQNSESGSQPRLNRGDSMHSTVSVRSATPTKNGSLKSKDSSPVKRGVSRSKSKSADKELDKTAIAHGGDEKKKKEQQYQEEKREAGNVKMSVYSFYLKSLGYVYFGSCFFFFVIFQLASSGSSIWLASWADNSDDPDKRDLYLGVYGGFGLAQVVTVVAAALLLYTSTLGGAKWLHNKMLENVLKSPMSFFDTTPQGRILNRFGKDVDVLDTTMPMILRGWITCLLAVIATFGLITYATPIFLLPLIVIAVCYYIVQRIYVATSRELKRLESVSRSPIYSHFGETVNGVQTIRAYNLQKSFIDENEAKVDNNQKANYPSVVANRWLSVRLESVGNLIIFMSTLFAVLNRNTLSPGLIGLSITYALSVTQTLNWLVRMTAEVETNIVAVERLKEYAETETEAAWNSDKGSPTDWPSKGVIMFDNYSTRYRKGQDLVLHNLSFEVSGGERVGIVGRTGAGKSSLTLALFRIVEPASGTICIDDVSISNLGLHELRSKLTIIPQDPVLFSGTLRINLDPFCAYSDDQVWRALELAHLKEFVTGLADGLEYIVAEGGENLSVGQRQLVCLARALLRKTKVLVLDEATAAVDMETDELIQATIRKEFSDCTILTIAHRLNTIIDYDKILVLDAGRKKEYDTPQNLLQDKTTIFYELCKEAGIA